MERGKCFIEYIPAEYAWIPAHADGYMYIDCLWVSGSFKGHGYSNDLLEECIRDSREKGKKGLCILAAAKKKPFLADPKFLKYKGFIVGDEADNGIQLWYLPFDKKTEAPRFKVDWDIILLGIYYVLVIFGYLFFERLPAHSRDFSRE